MENRYCIIIVTFNRKDLLKECVECVQGQGELVSDIVIVNNCSTDGTYDYLSGLKDSRIIIVNEKENLGGAGGFSEGVRYALQTEADWFVLIDDDAMMEKGFISLINAASSDNVGCCAFSGTVMEHGDIAINHRRRFSDSDTAVDKEEYNKQYFSYDCSSFCGLAVRRSIVEKIGIPRGEMFIWFDDTDYSLRIRKHTEIINVNAARIIHKTKNVSVDGVQGVEWRTYYGLRNRIFTYSRNGHFMYSLKIIKNDIKRIYKMKPDSTLSAQQIKVLHKVVITAVIDGVFGRLGKNERFLPR